GDRMPYFLVEGKSVYDRLHEPKFHLLTFFDGQGEEPRLPETIKEKYSELIDFQTIPLYPNIAQMFGAKESFVVLLRPDNYIGLISSDVSADTTISYLNRIFHSNK